MAFLLKPHVVVAGPPVTVRRWVPSVSVSEGLSRLDGIQPPFTNQMNYNKDHNNQLTKHKPKQPTNNKKTNTPKQTPKNQNNKPPNQKTKQIILKTKQPNYLPKNLTT